MGAINGTLTIFCGGSEDDFAEAEPVLAAYGRRVAHVGPNGAGQMMKMVNQIAVGGALMAICEALAFADKAGLDLAVTKDLVGSGAGGSWAFENYGPKILNRDWTPGFSVINQRKDFGYCREAAAEIGASLPGTEVVDRLLAVLEQAGRGQDTTAALFEVLMEMPPAP
jgi:3-hydroxyisobutyrate dehydrogenase-like beta-hydroxyacid dehydrogenase